MGYYSKVVIGFSEEAYQKFQKALIDAKKNKKYMWDDISYLMKRAKKMKMHGTNTYFYQWERIWNSNEFREVRWMENFLSSLSPDEFRFIRIEEEKGVLGQYIMMMPV